LIAGKIKNKKPTTHNKQHKLVHPTGFCKRLSICDLVHCTAFLNGDLTKKKKRRTRCHFSQVPLAMTFNTADIYFTNSGEICNDVLQEEILRAREISFERKVYTYKYTHLQR